MLATSLNVFLYGMITAVYKSGAKSDMSNYRSITVGPVLANLFAVIIHRRLALWAEEHANKATDQAGFQRTRAQLTTFLFSDH